MPISNVIELIGRMNRRAAGVEAELNRAARRIAILAGRKSKSILQDRIYSKPIPVRKRTGRPKWVRTGDLMRQETAQAQGTAVVMRNRSGHAAARRDLGTPRGRRIVSPGVESVQWQSEAAEAVRPMALEERRQAVLRVLRRG